MSHYRDTYKFETETEALAFAETQRKNSSPIEDKTVTGPFFMDENEIFKNWPGMSSGKTWWQVNIEIFR
jgi:hypothetical protein